MTDAPTKGRKGRPAEADLRDHEVEHYVRSGTRLSAVFGRHAPRSIPSDGTLTDWKVYAVALLTRSHYLLESTQALRFREPDAAVLARALYEHVVVFSWLCVAPEENVKKLIYWELCERRKGLNDLKAIGEDAPGTGIDALEQLLGGDFKPANPGLPALAHAADVHWGGRLGEIWKHRRGELRDLYPVLYRQFSAFTHPTVVGLHSLVVVRGNTARIGRPERGRQHAITLPPIVFALGLLVASETLGWPPQAAVLEAFEEPNA